MQRVPALLPFILVTILVASPLFASWDDGVAAFQAKRYDDAYMVFKDFVAKSPDAAAGHFMLGMTQLRRDRSAEALSSLGRSVELAPSENRYRLALAQAQIQAKRHDDAVATLAEVDPAKIASAQRETFQLLLAKAASGASKGSAAFAAVERALTGNPNSKNLWLARAKVAKKIGRAQEAFNSYSKAFALDPQDASTGRRAAVFAISLAQAEKPNDERRLEWYRRATEVAQDLAESSPTLQHQLLAGEAWMGAQKYEKARDWFRQAATAEGAGALPHYYLGRCSLALEEPSQALEHLEAALANEPSDELIAQIHASNGSAFRRLEDFDRAAEAYRLAGDETTANEMAGYAANRAEVAAAKAECVQKRSQLETLLKETEGLEHTLEYQQVVEDLASIKAACKGYFDEA